MNGTLRNTIRGLSALVGLAVSDFTSSSNYLNNDPVDKAVVSYEPVNTEYIGIFDEERSVNVGEGLDGGTLERKVGVSALDSDGEMQDSIRVYSDSEAREIYDSWSSKEQDEFDRSREAYNLEDPTPFQEAVQEASARSIFSGKVNYSNLGDGDLMTLHKWAESQGLELEKSESKTKESPYEFGKFEN